MDSTDTYRVSAHLPESLLTWGKVKAMGDGTLIAGATCDLDVEVTIAQAIDAGLSIEVWTHFVSDLTRVYVEDDDGVATFDCASDGTPVRPRTYPEAKVHGPGSFFPYRRYAAVQLPEGASPGARLHFHFRDISMQTYEEILFNLRFAIVASERDTVVGYLGDAFYRVVGGPPASLRLIAPTCVEVDAPFDCHIIVCDRYGNKTSAALADLSFEIATEAGPAPTTMGQITYNAEWQRHTLRGVKCASEGVTYLRARLKGTDTAVTGVSNPIIVRQRWQERVYWGDLHQHAYYCDGRGTPAANYAYAISTTCLDFCAVTPHEEYTFAPGLLRVPAPPQRGWEEMIEAAERYNGDDLVTLLGSEPGGVTAFISHVNAYYLDPNNRPVTERLLGKWWESPGKRAHAESYQQFLDELERTKGEFLLLPHAHARGGPGKYALPILPAYQTNVEICSVHGVFEAFYEQWLKHGHYVGVHGGGDNHMTSTGNGNPGYHYPNTNGLAAAWAGAHTRRGVWDAIKNRTTYAVTGNQRIFLEFHVNDAPMGSVIDGESAPRNIRIAVAGTAPLMRVDLLRNGEVMQTYRPAVAEHQALRLTWTDDWCSRRVDDSLTTGTIALENGQLTLLQALHVYHRTDAFNEDNGALVFRSNGYSGITRGVLVDTSGNRDVLHFEIEDHHLGEVILNTTLHVPLEADHAHLTRPLRATEGARRPLFTREPHHPHFILEADWVDLGWPRTVDLAWIDDDPSPATYTVRVEQIDGNIAWSSPVWFKDDLPEQAIPGRVIRR